MERGYWAGGTENFTMQRALEWQREREKASMTTGNQTSSVRSIPLAALTFSTTPAQIERRAHLDKGKLRELADSIKSHGLVQPILVRPLFETVNGRYTLPENFEVVAGERRAIAAKQAGLEEIQATVRELTDEQVLELQLIENLQRQDLHELAEAEGYEALQKLGHTIEDMAAKTGKSKATIYARMKLLALCQEGRAALYAGNINASTALLLARIQVQSVQKQALKDVNVREEDGPMSAREAARIIQHKYMLRLSEASFDTKLEDLAKGAPACGRCPKNTISQPELFGDVKADRAGVCTDPGCFQAKREAWGRLMLERARGAGQKVIVGAEAKKISPYGSYITGGYTRLDEPCWDDPKRRTYKQILGREGSTVLLQQPDGTVIEIVPKVDALKKLRADGIIKPVKHDRPSSSGRGAAKDRQAEELLQERLFAAIHAKAPKQISRKVLETVIDHELDVLSVLPGMLEKAYGWKEGVGLPDLEKMSEPQLHQLLWELVFLGELSGGEHDTDKLINVAKSLKIDVPALRKQLATEQKAAAPAKASKKKAAKK